MNYTPVRFLTFVKGAAQRRGMIFGAILLLALLAFEVFNYSTTDYALTDMLGANLKFLGLRWATILSIAFCGIDFAGIARLFTPEQGRDEPAEVWYLFGAWLLAAAMNAILTWWGVGVAVRSHQELSTLIVNQNIIIRIVPVFVALMVWLIRVLIIGTFSMAGERMFSLDDARAPLMRKAVRLRPMQQTQISENSNLQRPVRRPAVTPFNPAPKPEPTYHPVGMAASAREEEHSMRR
jgi:hypothetical protein